MKQPFKRKGQQQSATVYTERRCAEDKTKKSGLPPALTASTNRIKFFRLLLLVFLVITGALSGVISFVILKRKENDKYESDFESAVNEIFIAVDEGFQLKVVTLDHMSTLDSYRCPHAKQWPNCSLELEYFEDLTASLMDMSMCRSIASNPVVHLQQQESFESFAYDLFEREGFPSDAGLSPFGRGMYAKHANGSRYADDGCTSFSDYEVFVPVFYPANVEANWPGIMYNMHSEPIRAAAIDAVLSCAHSLSATQRSGSSIVQRCTAVSDFIQLVSDSEPRPASIIFTPVFPHKDNTSLVGMNTIIFNWDMILGMTDILGVRSLDCVVETTAGVGGASLTRHSFELSAGAALYKGEGDHHSSSAPNNRISLQLSYGTELATSVTYTLHFQPNQAFYDHYHTMIPALASVVCVAIAIAISVLFVAYDWLVKHEAVENKMLLDSKRVFVRFVSHEIRTPINTITLGLQLLTSRLSSLDPSMFQARGSSTAPSPACSKNESELRKYVDCTPHSPGPASHRSTMKRRMSATSASPSEIVQECLELVGELKESSKTAVVVLDELINYDKIEMEKFHVERQVCDVYSVLRDTFRPLEVQAKQRKVTLTLQKMESMDKALFVIGDKVKLGQVFRNVISNALKFAPAKSNVTVQADWNQESTLSAVQESTMIRLDPITGDEFYHVGDVVIAVADTGPGLSAEQQQSMFQEGVQFNANELQAGGGSGLGLWISREIVKQHGGVIAVMSEGLGKGCTFSVTIPVLRPLLSWSKNTSRRNGYGNSLNLDGGDLLSMEVPSRVLVVDDTVTSVKILSRLLTSAGMEVTVAYNGQECLEKVRACSADSLFDLIVMDYEMPQLDGPDATRALREAGYTLPIIGVTGNVLPEDREHFLASGANAVLPKPLHLSSLLGAYSDVVLVGRTEQEAAELKEV